MQDEFNGKSEKDAVEDAQKVVVATPSSADCRRETRHLGESGQRQGILEGASIREGGGV